MNLQASVKKCGERWRASPLPARILQGEGPGKTFSRFVSSSGRSLPRHSLAGAEQKRHLAATTLLTSMFGPSTLPVTVAFFPAC